MLLLGFVLSLHAQNEGVGFPSPSWGIALGKPEERFAGLRLTALDYIEPEGQVNGISFAVVYSALLRMNGINISPLFAYDSLGNGITIGGLFAGGEVHHGLSVGLFGTIYKQKNVGVGLSAVPYGIGGDTLYGLFGPYAVGTPIGTAEDYAKVLSGVSITALLTQAHHLNGLGVSGVFLCADTLQGVAIGAYTKIRHVRGLVVGAVNVSERVQGVEFGLVNIVRGNRRWLRVLPLVGFGWR